MTSGFEQLLHRPRPSAWKLFLRQPCVYLARLLYAWRRTIPAQAVTNPLSIVCISDTHNSEPAFPDADVLIHAGDFTQSGTFEELEATVAWLHGQPHPIKIVIAGNDDILLDAQHSAMQEEDVRQRKIQKQMLEWGDIVYLENAEKTILCPNGRQLRVYGSPLSPRHGNWAFQYPRTQDLWAHKIPPEVDILITHGPPRAHLDLHYGCVHLLKELWRIRPRLHVFGHIHEGFGTEWVQFDELQAAYERTVIDNGGIWNSLVVFLRLCQQCFQPAVEAKCLLVNPSMVGGLRDKERRHAMRVVL